MRKTIIGIMLVLLTGCNQNQRAKNFGGTAKIELQKNQKLVTATWKDNNLWILTRPMRESETPENYTFKEESSFGVLQGTVFISEKK